MKPGSLPFAVDIISPARECLDRDSSDHLLPGAYIILKDGSNRSPILAPRNLDSKELNLFPRAAEINTAPSSVPANAFCNITGAPLNDENRSVVQIIRDRNTETRWVILLRQFDALPTDFDTPRNFLTMTSSLQPHFDNYAFGVDVDDNYRIIQFAQPSPDFDVSNVGTLKLAEGQEMPYDECLRLHFHFCLRMYVSSPPPGVQAYTMRDVQDLEEEIGMNERDESLPELADPVWSSPLGQEILRAAMAQRCAYFLSLV
ncbi:hypothetical protein BS47DRAFT_145105 [Hydnum rufescens UP504]|uniref:HNH nuclease domain-containing protein n=1 Tax=Hydnum rufescens UP504 TaxID=1448309 RepID=A0A9P6APJ3_9AGAM|nr:hypothetical protein BS47DRAFT_145105 [Hydnum rufescens UP504]